MHGQVTSYSLQMFLLFVLLVCSFNGVVSKSCCGDPGCGESCPWSDSCSDGTDTACMDRIAGPFKCRDKSLCNTIEECDEEEAAYRAGNLCHNFPWYNGGYPIDKIHIEREEKSFGCTKESSNSEYCQEFYLFKESIDEFGGGSSQCVEESSNGQYCYRWTLRKEEYRKCWIYNYIDDDRTLVTAVACCANGATSGCCQKLCDTSFYNAYPPEIEYGDCHCTAESANGQYCESWYCEEFYYPSQTYGQNRERLYYDCAEESVSGEFCEGWKTRMDSVKKFEVSNCACDEPHVDDASGVMKYCAKWSCQEHQVEYYWPNMGWALFSAIFGLVPVAVALVGMFYAEKTQDWIWWYLGLSVVWGGGFAFIGVWKAGLGVLFTTFIPMHGLVLLIMMYRYSNKEKIASCFQGLYNVPTRFFGANVQESKEDLEKAEQNSDVGSTSSEPVAVAQPVPIKQDAESMVLEDRIRNLRDQMNSGEISRSRYHVLVTSAVEELYL